jgi:hypothetical protein
MAEIATACNGATPRSTLPAMVAEHLVAHTRFGDRSLLSPRRAAWLWAHLRSKIPDALSCVIMPDHVHVVAPPGRREVFLRVLRAFTGLFRVRFDMLPEERANSAAIALRMMRYGFYNPVNDGLVDDPFAWRFSTLRDLVGAAHPIWTGSEAVATTLAIERERLLARLSLTADHRPPPPRGDLAIAAPLPVLREAVSAALRAADLDNALARRLIVQAAHEIATPGVRRLAAELGCSERTIFRDRATREPALDAVLVCLGDPRLHRAPGPVANPAVGANPPAVGRRG